MAGLGEQKQFTPSTDSESVNYAVQTDAKESIEPLKIKKTFG